MAAALEALERLGPAELPPEAAATSGEVGPGPAPQDPAPKRTEPAPVAVTVPAPAPPPPSPGFFRNPTTAWTLVGAGGGLLLGSVVTGVIALQAGQELERYCDPQCDPQLAGTQSLASGASIATDVLWVSATVLAGTGVVLLLTQPKESERALGLRCGPAGCGTAFGGVF